MAVDSRLQVQAVLQKLGVPGLFNMLYEAANGEILNLQDEDAIALYIRETPEYKKRFAGNEARRARGLPDLSVSTYIGIEDSYKNTLKSNGMPANMYNEESMAQLIAGDVDVQEFNDRISYAREVMMDSPASVREQMSQLYGITEGQMLAYFVDPERTAPILKEQARAAKIGSIAKENAGIQLTATTAQDLAKRDVTDSSAQTAFSNIFSMGELNTQMAGEESISQSQLIGSELGFDPASKLKIRKRKEQRVAEFTGGGSFANSQGQTQGSSQSSLGGAQ